MAIEMDYTSHRSLAAACLDRASQWVSGSQVGNRQYAKNIVRDYNDYKARQILELLRDQIMTEVKTEAWFADLGINGCT